MEQMKIDLITLLLESSNRNFGQEFCQTHTHQVHKHSHLIYSLLRLAQKGLWRDGDGELHSQDENPIPFLVRLFEFVMQARLGSWPHSHTQTHIHRH